MTSVLTFKKLVVVLSSESESGHKGNSVFVTHNFTRYALHVLAHFS